MPPKPKSPGKTKPAKKAKTIATLRHDAKRKNLPTAEYESLMRTEDKSPIAVAYARRNRDLDPQLVWRGKDSQDWSDLVVPAPPLYIQEKVHPKVLIDDLLRQSKERATAAAPQIDLFADFNGLPKDARATEFYQHDAHWSNRMILGDSLQVMASLSEREGLRGKVQCLYFDPPYGIKFNSNFQWSTTSRDVKDGNAGHITREPEQVKAFRDTWRDGIHSYLTYLRDRLTVARDLLADSGSIFVQIGDENVHRVRAVMDEIFGNENVIALITVQKMAGLASQYLKGACDYVVWFCKDIEKAKYRQMFYEKKVGEGHGSGARYDQMISPFGERVPLKQAEEKMAEYEAKDFHIAQPTTLTTFGSGGSSFFEVQFQGKKFWPTKNKGWLTHAKGISRLNFAGRIIPTGDAIRYLRRLDDYPCYEINNVWTDIASPPDVVYVVQTSTRVIERCIQMTTDPGDLVLDPTCGSGTTAYVAEQWGRRWITMDTSRVALALARARIMGARYPFYLLADSRDGQFKEAEVTRALPSEQPTHGNLHHGFVYERVPHITLKSIANNAEIDVIWDKWQQTLEPLREQLNQALKKNWQEWEIPRDITEFCRSGREEAQTNSGKCQRLVTSSPTEIEKLHTQWWEARIARQKEIDASIAAKAEFEFLYDKPYDDKSKVRVAGPFTVETLSPHRVLTVDENDNVVDGWKLSENKAKSAVAGTPDFAAVILENLKLAGVQQAHKEDRITFTSLTGWPGKFICAEGRYLEGANPGGCDTPSQSGGSSAPAAGNPQARRRGVASTPGTDEVNLGAQRRAAIFIGPEFGTVSRPDLVAAAREAADANFDVLIACAFNYDAHSAEFEKLGRIPVLKARMNPDLHMAGELKNTGAGNLFVIFGEPDIEIQPAGKGEFTVQVKGVDVFKPQTGEVVSAGPEGIACWFIDTDYNEESFFVRHAYFLGQNDPYQALKTSLRAEVDQEAWESLHSAVSRPFPKPTTGRIAVKVINHLGDEVMKVFKV